MKVFFIVIVILVISTMSKTLLLICIALMMGACQEKPKQAIKVLPCTITPLIIDTTLLEPNPNSEYYKGNSGEEIQDGNTGCIIFRKLTVNIYWDPLINHSEI